MELAFFGALGSVGALFDLCQYTKRQKKEG
jgi:hypothetical protein